MADTQRLSQIPVMTPRASHTSFPSALSSPHLGLVPPSRYPSVSGSPTLPTPTTSSPPPSGGGSTPFRTFRNFLSFGGGSKQTSPSASAIPKSHFSTLGTIRRSVNVERRASSPQLNVRRSDDDYVLSIDLARPGDERSPNTRLPKGSDPSPTARSLFYTAQPSRSHSPGGDTGPASPSATPALAATELSTILESETSGISKHLPSLDTSQASHDAESERDSVRHTSPHAFQPQALYPPSRDTRRGSTSPSNDTSILDLSTSKLRSEVLAALSETGGKQDWSNGVVLDDVPSDAAISRGRTPESPDAGFNLNSLDPDLAALLSPHRMQGSAEPALLVAIDAIPPPTSSPPPPSPTKLAFSPGTSPRTPPEMQASTSMRRAYPTSLSVSSRPPPNLTSLPRITRSVSDRPGSGAAGKLGPPSPITRTPSGRAMSSSPERPPSTAVQSRFQRPSTTDSTANSSVRRPGSSGHREDRRTPASRLMTPARPSSASASRPPLSRLNSTPNAAWDAESVSPSSRPPSSIGTAPSRLQSHRPSLDIERPRLVGGTRTRKRSTSVIEHRVSSPAGPAPPLPAPKSMTDWLGPRTAKAFAAAGLLDFEKDSPGSASRPSSRFGTARSSIERDARSRYTPSRMAYSEAGSSSSWGARSGSVSRAAGYSEGMSAGGPSSEAVSTPRTVFSSASTAATSVSASYVHTEIQQLQDKHALETSALLNALADSQRTAHMLRDENGQLRDRIQMLEDKLVDAQERIQQILYSVPPPLASKSMYASRYGSPASSERRSTPSHSRNNSFLRPRAEVSPYADWHSSPEPPSASPETPYDAADAFAPFVPPRSKRMSSASSLFASLPSNMSMIMQEEGVTPPDAFTAFSHHSSSSQGSPTMVLARSAILPRAPSSSRGGHSHRANRSVSSAGNVSPTTASFSVVTSSPGSLNLRPEHERHLGDMPPLDLDADGFEFEEDALLR